MSLVFLKVACRAVAFKPEFLHTQKNPLVWPQGTALGFVTICDPAMLIMLLGKWKPTSAEPTFNTKVSALEFWEGELHNSISLPTLWFRLNQLCSLKSTKEKKKSIILFTIQYSCVWLASAPGHKPGTSEFKSGSASDFLCGLWISLRLL